MPIDPRIPLMSQPVQLPNMLDLYGKAEELKASRQRNKLADLAFAEKERATQDANAISGLYRDATNPDGALNRDKFLSGAAQKGFGSRIPEWQKSFAEQDEAQFKVQKAQREAKKEQIATARSQVELLGQVAGSARDQASWERGLQFLQSQGIDTSQMNPTYDPAYVEQGRQMALSAAQQYEQLWKQLGYDLDVQQFGETKRHHLATEATAAKAASNQAAMPKAPAGYRYGPDGNLQAIPGGPADKAATVSEGERNASGFAERMIEADRIAAEIAGKDAGAQKPGFIEQLAGNGMIGNTSRSPARQQYRQAQEDWVRAKLRKESGAAIGAEEMEREISMYFPQIGDSPEVIAQKSRARATANQAMLKSSGRAAPKPAAPKNDAPDDIADLLEKYGK